MEEVFRYDFQWHHVYFAGNKVEEVWTVIVYGFCLEYDFMKSLNDTDSVHVKTMGNKGHDDKQYKHTHTQYSTDHAWVSLDDLVYIYIYTLMLVSQFSLRTCHF